MKITRQKHAKKHIGFFRNNFGVREPYQILLDGTFCQAALRGRIQLREQLPRYLMGETQLCTTRWARRVWETDATAPRPPLQHTRCRTPAHGS
jgi:U3 small nucleolar RNA-associated protein 23